MMTRPQQTPDQAPTNEGRDEILPSPRGGGSARDSATGWRGGGRQGRQKIDQFKRATAKRVRDNDTAAEQILWRALHRLPMEGSHFRRQVPIGNYVADFCLSAKLILEVDGSQHSTPTGLTSDAERTAWLEREGFQVLRFWNNDVAGDIDAVLEHILAALSERLAPRTPPRRAARADPPPRGESRKRGNRGDKSDT
jgi:very-short-patch-repair endonuclease